jgi:hypothetical protein
MKVPVLLALVALASTPAVAARADEDDVRADVRCVLAMYALMNSPDRAANAFWAAAFFTGRLEGRDPKFDVNAAIKQELPRMSQSDFPHEMQRCGEEAKVRSTMLLTVGTELKKMPQRRN